MNFELLLSFRLGYLTVVLTGLNPLAAFGLCSVVFVVTGEAVTLTADGGGRFARIQPPHEGQEGRLQFLRIRFQCADLHVVSTFPMRPVLRHPGRHGPPPLVGQVFLVPHQQLNRDDDDDS